MAQLSKVVIDHHFDHGLEIHCWLPSYLQCRLAGVADERDRFDWTEGRTIDTHVVPVIQADAIKNIQIDKVTVWDGGTGKDGKTSTANFISGLDQSVPPLSEVFKMPGLELPSYLGTETKPVDPKTDDKSTPPPTETDKPKK